MEELENWDVSKIHARRLNAKEIVSTKIGEHFVFPIAQGAVKLSGRDQVFQKSTFKRDQPVRDEELSGNLRGGSSGSQSTDEKMHDREVRNDYWSIEGNYIYRHHVEPRVQLYVPNEESFTIPLRYNDMVRRTKTSLDVLR